MTSPFLSPEEAMYAQQQPAPVQQTTLPSQGSTADLENINSQRLQQSPALQQGSVPAINPTQPDNAQAPTAPAPEKYGLLKRLLTNFVYNGSQALKASQGLPTDFEIQQKNAQIAQVQAQTEHLKAQTAQMAQMVTLPNGVTMPYGLAIKAYPSLIAAQGHVQGAQIGADAKIGAAKIAQGQGVPVDETIANLVGMPEIAGKPAGKALWANINSAIKANGYAYKDLGNDGLWLMDRAGNKIKRIADSPSIASAQARGQSFAMNRAAFSPFETVDENGQPTTTSVLNAIQTGAPGIGKTNLQTALGKQALIEDIRGGVQQVKDLAHVLDRGQGVRAKIAGLLASPGLTAQTFAQSPIAASMQPDEQQYVINLLNLKENAMAMRSVLGAGQGSEDLRTAITKTIPNAMTPNSQYANAQLDTFLNTLGRLEKGVVKVKAPAGGTKPAAAMPKAADPLGIR